MAQRVLLIDDSAFFRKQMEQMLTGAGYEVLMAETGEQGLRMVALEKPDIVLLDVTMPDMDGFEVCRILREQESNNLMPILLVTSRDDQEEKLIGLELGADDYIVKPFNEREVLARIRNTLRRISRNRAANPLTGLPGNLEIQREINSRIASGKPYAVVYIDLDNFKAFNDVYGFAKGDLAIKMTADILQKQVGLFGNRDDFVGHIGGDDFMFISTPDKAVDICKNCIAAFDKNIRTLFSEEDVARGYVSAVNRKGQTETYPITSISMGIVTNEKRTFASHLEISDSASGLKKVLKALPGSNYMKDRRTS